MHDHRALPASRLSQPCNPDDLPFLTSDELEPLEEEFAHPRAVEALRFGLEVRQPGYNLFLMGAPRTGRHGIARRLIVAAGGLAPADWCYVHNFSIPERPIWLRLPAGEGRRLREAMEAVAADPVTAFRHLAALRETYADLQPVAHWLDAVAAHAPDERCRVNLLVDNAGCSAPPIVYEDHPTLANLAGRIGHRVFQGMLVADFSLIQAGALHRANGGYLLVDAHCLLAQPGAWEGLKRLLAAGEIRVEPPEPFLGVPSAAPLLPEPIPLEVKVALVGESFDYYLLSDLDPDFQKLFKVAADFESEIDRSADNTRLYARLLGTLARRRGLRPLQREAVARLIEHAARLAEDAERLTTATGRLADLLVESDHWAAKAGAAAIARSHVDQAIAAAIRRVDRLRHLQHSDILRGTTLIATEGRLIGQLNGLAAVDLADFAFAHPVRITAAVRMGEGEMIDIEREVQMGGPLHSKGVLILAAFFGGRFGRLMPLSFNASVVFEQSYGDVEGDSASLAELCALISALGAVPVKQSLAVTGSVSQYGAVHAIGAVNEKIEGFFDICRARGLTGDQGVIVPAANAQHLMLREDVIEAVAEGRFHVYVVGDVDEAMEILCDLPAGQPDERGMVPEGSINHRVVSTLAEMIAARESVAEAAHKKPGRKKKTKPGKAEVEVPVEKVGD